MLHLTRCLAAALLTLTLTAGCDKAAAPAGTDDTALSDGLLPGQCRTMADCSQDDLLCATEDDSLCGTCADTELMCAEDVDCGEGKICLEYTPSCPCSGGQDPSTACIIPCTTTGCDAGTECDEASGVCEPIHCTDGATCATHTTCDADASGTGCVRDTCAADADCGTAAWCVRGGCFSEPGECTSVE